MSGADGCVYLVAPDSALRERTARALRAAGARVVTTVPTGDPPPDTVVVTVAVTVDEAMDACQPALRERCPLLVVADRFPLAGVARAVRSGARAALRSADASPENLAAAVRAARHGDGRMPHELLVRLLTGGAENDPAVRRHPRSPLTARQTEVLALMAEGHGNAEIARCLSCSQHTVKNVIYDLMTRLSVRNRAHAVACAVRSGLI